ncbi:MAG: FecR family protein [Bacteroidota bacterium]
MNKNGIHTEFQDLAAKYLTGSANPEEVDRLEVWVRSDGQMRQEFSEIKKAWMLASASKDTYNKTLAWEKIAGQTFRQDHEDNVRKLHPSSSFNKNLIWKIAAVFLLLIVGVYTAYYLAGQRQKTWTTTNEPQERILHDGSSVNLHRNSTLAYKARFSGDERRVKLEGEAFFEVTHSEKSHFIVETSDVEIHVLGTSFYVNARSEAERTEVIVQTGKVAMIASEEHQLPLEKGQKGIYNRQREELIETMVESPNFMSWKTRVIMFDDTSLKEVFDVIADTYGVSFQLANPQLEDCRLTAVFNDRPLSDVLAVIAETFALRYTRSQEVIIISGEGC